MVGGKAHHPELLLWQRPPWPIPVLDQVASLILVRLQTISISLPTLFGLLCGLLQTSWRWCWLRSGSWPGEGCKGILHVRHLNGIGVQEPAHWRPFCVNIHFIDLIVVPSHRNVPDHSDVHTRYYLHILHPVEPRSAASTHLGCFQEVGRESDLPSLNGIIFIIHDDIFIELDHLPRLEVQLLRGFHQPRSHLEHCIQELAARSICSSTVHIQSRVVDARPASTQQNFFCPGKTSSPFQDICLGDGERIFHPDAVPTVLTIHSHAFCRRIHGHDAHGLNS